MKNFEFAFRFQNELAKQGESVFFPTTWDKRKTREFGMKTNIAGFSFRLDIYPDVGPRFMISGRNRSIPGAVHEIATNMGAKVENQSDCLIAFYSESPEELARYFYRMAMLFTAIA